MVCANLSQLTFGLILDGPDEEPASPAVGSGAVTPALPDAGAPTTTTEPAGDDDDDGTGPTKVLSKKEKEKLKKEREKVRTRANA